MKATQDWCCWPHFTAGGLEAERAHLLMELPQARGMSQGWSWHLNADCQAFSLCHSAFPAWGVMARQHPPQSYCPGSALAQVTAGPSLMDATMGSTFTNNQA